MNYSESVIDKLRKHPAKYYETELGVLLHGDCLEIMQEIPEKSIDLVLTDPPYGINYQSNMRVITEKFPKLQNDNNTFRLKSYFKFYSILQTDCVVVCFCSFKNYTEDYTELSKYFDIKNCIIWFKRGGGIGDLSYSLLTDYEMAIVAHKGKCNIRGKRYGSVWESIKVNPSGMFHPTQKPVDIMEKIIDTYSDKNNIVFDPYIGSGTTAVACEQLGRRWIGIEISKEYCEISKQRIKAEADQLKFL